MSTVSIELFRGPSTQLRLHTQGIDGRPGGVCVSCYFSGCTRKVGWAVGKGSRARLRLQASCTVTSEWSLGLEHFLHRQGRKPSQPVRLVTLCGNAIPAIDSMHAPSLCLSTGGGGPQAHPAPCSTSSHCSRQGVRAVTSPLQLQVNPLAVGD